MERFLTQAMIVCFILGSSRVAAQRCNELHPVTSPFNESAWLSCIDGVEPVVSASTPDTLYDLLSNLGAADVTVVITADMSLSDWALKATPVVVSQNQIVVLRAELTSLPDVTQGLPALLAAGARNLSLARLPGLFEVQPGGTLAMVGLVLTHPPSAAAYTAAFPAGTIRPAGLDLYPAVLADDRAVVATSYTSVDFEDAECSQALINSLTFLRGSALASADAVGEVPGAPTPAYYTDEVGALTLAMVNSSSLLRLPGQFMVQVLGPSLEYCMITADGGGGDNGGGGGGGGGLPAWAIALIVVGAVAAASLAALAALILLRRRRRRRLAKHCGPVSAGVAASAGVPLGGRLQGGASSRAPPPRPVRLAAPDGGCAPSAAPVAAGLAAEPWLGLGFRDGVDEPAPVPGLASLDAQTCDEGLDADLTRLAALQSTWRGAVASSLDLEFLETLAHNRGATVWRGRWRGSPVAIKVVEDPARAAALAAEGDLIQSLSHPNVVSVYMVCAARGFDLGAGAEEGGRPEPRAAARVIVMELCDRGSLQDCVRVGGCGLWGADAAQPNEEALLRLFIDVATALDYLHSSGVVHGDLKTGNVLLTSAANSKRGYRAKVGDFGCSSKLCQPTGSVECGTLSCLAPEIFAGAAPSPAADCYAFGILVWEAWTRRRAYEGMPALQIMAGVAHEGTRPPLPADMPPALSSLVWDCWVADPAARPDSLQILRRLRAQLASLGADLGRPRHSLPHV
ncbi:hypothetical protein ACKKBG_A00420 [Auxenochlorella protothecoides x Auxenochlorella symbiontica]